MASTLNTDESSVMFNLRELLRLQGEREAEEVRAEQAVREAEAQAQLLAARRVQEAEAERVEQARRALAAEAERAQRMEQRAQTEREAALLRVQLEAAASERARESALARDVEQAAARVASQWRRRTLTLLAAVALCAAGVSWTMQQQLAATSGTKQALETQLRENASLRAKLQQTALIEQQPTRAPTTPQPTAAAPKPTRTPATSRAKTKLKPLRTSHATTQEPELGSDTSDPIEGL